MLELTQRLSRSSVVYRKLVEGASANNPIDRLQLFAYRSSILESEVFKPVVLWLLDPEKEAVPTHQFVKSLDVLESWLVRRMLVRGATNGYNQIAAELVASLSKGSRDHAGQIIEEFFASQTVGSRYWPDDDEIRNELAVLAAYRRLRRGRLRMVLEAIEDHRRGWQDGAEGLGGERVARGKYHIEHVMPRRWQLHWPLEPAVTEQERDGVIHQLGNLTLLTSKLNSKVSNGPWLLKRAALAEHDVLKMNVDLLTFAGETWNEAKIAERTVDLTKAILEIWPVPDGHKTSFGHTVTRQLKKRVGLDDLISAGLLEPGTTLYVLRKAFSHRTAVVLPDGRIDVDGQFFQTPTGAAKYIYEGKSANGWWFFRLGSPSGPPIGDLLERYLNQTSEEIDDDTADDDGDDEDGDGDA